MRTLLLFVCLTALAMGQQTADQVIPTTMTKIVVHLESPDAPEGSFAAQPKTMYRAGTRYCRIEEMPDTKHGIHGLAIVNEPDAWMINLMTKTAQHMLDPGPTLNCRLPIFAKDVKSLTSNQTNDLEFGRELAFFQEKGATSKPGPVLQGKPTKVYTVDLRGSQLLLFTTITAEKPISISRQRGRELDAYWYITYENVPFDSKLFAKPNDIKIESDR